MEVCTAQPLTHDGVADAGGNDGERQERDQDIAGVLIQRLPRRETGRVFLYEGEISSGARLAC